MQSLLSNLSPLAAILALVVTLLVGFIGARVVAPSKVVTKVVRSLEDEEVVLIKKQIDLVADNSADVKRIADAQQSMAARAVRTADLYGYINAKLAPPAPIAPSTGGVANT